MINHYNIVLNYIDHIVSYIENDIYNIPHIDQGQPYPIKVNHNHL